MPLSRQAICQVKIPSLSIRAGQARGTPPTRAETKAELPQEFCGEAESREGKVAPTM